MTPEQAAALFNALIAFAIALLLWLAKMFSNKTSASSNSGKSEPMEVAGAIVDNRVLQPLIASLDRFADNMPVLAAAMTSLQAEMVEVRKSLDRNSEDLRENTEGAEDMLDGIKAVNGTMDRMVLELRLSGQHHDRTIPPGHLR